MTQDKTYKTTINVSGLEIAVTSTGDINNNYISLADMTKNFEGGKALIEQWLRNKDTILFLGTWEKVYSPEFNSPQFEGIRNEEHINWSNSFSLHTNKTKKLSGGATNG